MTLSGMENQDQEATNASIKNHLLFLPYKVENGIHIVNSMKRYVNKILPENVKVKTAYTGKELSSFETKNKTKFEHQQDIKYQVKCSIESYLDNYNEESARLVKERVTHQIGRDTKSLVLKHIIKRTCESYTERR